jgi:flagellar export protein FliJ
MPQFSFPFQTLLRLREGERQQRRLELAQACEAERLLQQHIDAAQAELASAEAGTRRASAPGEVHVDRLLELRRYTLSVQTMCRGLSQKQLQLRDEIERRRAALTEADRSVRVLEKLREKQEFEFQAQQRKQEQNIWDEIGARR